MWWYNKNKQNTPPENKGTKRDFKVLENVELNNLIPSFPDFILAVTYNNTKEDKRIKEAILMSSFNLINRLSGLAVWLINSAYEMCISLIAVSYTHLRAHETR